MVIATTARLQLRRFTKSDLRGIAKVFTDPSVVRYTLTGAFSPAQIESWLDRVITGYGQHDHGVWAVIRQDDQALIGYCALTTPEVDGQRVYEIGYRLDPDYWGRGLATEAARAVRDYGFEQLDLPQVVSLIQAGNRASIRVAEKIGMQHERDTVFADTPLRVYVVRRS
jgi:RimJ/RimL family protein N-acetyltransferase